MQLGVVSTGGNITGCWDTSVGEGNETFHTAQRRPTRPDLYAPSSVKTCTSGQRVYRTWIRPVTQYFNQQLARFLHFWSPQHLKEMAREILLRLGRWFLEIEMGFVWGVAGLSIFMFVFAAIWYIDPALLTLVLRFRQATCTTASAAFLIGVSNCSWTSCR